MLPVSAATPVSMCVCAGAAMVGPFGFATMSHQCRNVFIFHRCVIAARVQTEQRQRQCHTHAHCPAVKNWAERNRKSTDYYNQFCRKCGIKADNDPDN
eukprot:16082-Rhodomonas_salina.1